MPRIVRFARHGGPEVLEVRDEPLAEPGEGEVRLKIEAIGLNRAEIMFRDGAYIANPAFPSRIGIEASGVIDALGPGVSSFSIGDRAGRRSLQFVGRMGQLDQRFGHQVRPLRRERGGAGILRRPQS